MEISEYKNIYEHEKEHFFYVSTHQLVLNLVGKWLGKKRKNKILDAGCGTGLLAKRLSVFGNVTGVDYSQEAIKFAKKNGINAIQASLTKLPFENNSFDLITSVDVLVCIKDDLLALKELNRVLKPGGKLILRTSGVKWLSLAHDRFVHSIRRYNMSELDSKLSSAGFDVLDIYFVHMPIFLVAIIRHFYEKTLPQTQMESGIKNVNKWINLLISKILCLEANIIFAGVKLPIGMGLISIATKPRD